MKFLKFLFIFTIFSTLSFGSFLKSFSADERLNIEDVTFAVYDIPTEKEGMNNLYVYLKMPYNFFRFIKEEDIFIADYEFSIEISDEENNIHKNNVMQEKIVVSNFEDTNSDEKIFFKEIEFEVSPGKYNIRLVITDLDMRKSITQSKEITLKDFWKEEIGISDIIFYVEGDSSFNSGKNIIIPEPNVNVDYNSNLVIDYYIFKSDIEKRIVLNSKIIPKFKTKTPVYEENEEIYDKKNLTKREIRLIPELISVGPYVFRINVSSEEIKREREIEFSLLWENFPISALHINTAIGRMKYILTEEEYEKISLMNQAEKKDFFIDFWKEFDIDTTMEKNEVMEEYFRRLNYTDQNFSDPNNDGWESDRGRIWILYGKPDNVIKRHNLIPPYETWEYYNINKRYNFWDEFSIGVFKLKSIYDIRR